MENSEPNLVAVVIRLQRKLGRAAKLHEREREWSGLETMDNHVICNRCDIYVLSSLAESCDRRGICSCVYCGYCAQKVLIHCPNGCGGEFCNAYFGDEFEEPLPPCLEQHTVDCKFMGTPDSL